MGFGEITEDMRFLRQTFNFVKVGNTFGDQIRYFDFEIFWGFKI